jgi:hypothetical protein
MSDLTKGSFSLIGHKQHCKLRREKYIKGVTAPKPSDNARKRFEQKMIMLDVDQSNAVIKEAAKYAKPTPSDMSDEDNMSSRKGRGLSYIFDFEQRGKIPRLLRYKMTNPSRITDRVSNDGGGLGEFEDSAFNNQFASLRKTAANHRFGTDERDCAKAPKVNDLMYTLPSSIGGQADSTKPSYNEFTFAKEPRARERSQRLQDKGADYMMGLSGFGTQVQSYNSNATAVGIKPPEKADPEVEASLRVPGPGAYLKATDAELTAMSTRPKALSATMLGKWRDKAEKESTRDAITEGRVGPGSYESWSSVGKQPYSMNRSLPAHQFGSPPPKFP